MHYLSNDILKASETDSFWTLTLLVSSFFKSVPAWKPNMQGFLNDGAV